MGENYVTQAECEDRRKDIHDRIEKNTGEIMELKIISAKTESTLSSMLTICKAIFGAVASGIVSVIIILLTRGL